LCRALASERFRLAEFAIVRCEACDLEWVYPTPSQTVIDAVYRSGYFEGAGAGYADYFARERESNLVKAEQRLDILQQLGATSGRLLDFGAADGTFVGQARARSFDAYGVEVSAEAQRATPAALRPFIYSTLADAGPGAFDVVTLWDVLEHLTDFPETLKLLRRATTNSGLVAIVVPVIDNWNARRAPETWDQYKPPEHLTYFSTRSLRAALETWVGPVIHESAAWTRYARRCNPALQAAPKDAARFRTRFRGVEAGLARLAERVGLAHPSTFLDSVLMVVRVSSEAPDAANTPA
jgi:hypothetical protein